MSRVTYPDPKSQAPDTVDLLSRIGNLNVTRMMSHAPSVMKVYVVKTFETLGACF